MLLFVCFLFFCFFPWWSAVSPHLLDHLVCLGCIAGLPSGIPCCLLCVLPYVLPCKLVRGKLCVLILQRFACRWALWFDLQVCLWKRLCFNSSVRLVLSFVLLLFVAGFAILTATHVLVPNCGEYIHTFRSKIVYCVCSRVAPIQFVFLFFELMCYSKEFFV